VHNHARLAYNFPAAGKLMNSPDVMLTEINPEGLIYLEVTSA
jgi:hypothetical protein